MKKWLAVMAFAMGVKGVSAGEAIIPVWNLYAEGTSCFSISNVTNTPLNFKFELYQRDGTQYTGVLDFAKGISALAQDTQLNGHSSAQFCLKRYNTDKFGYGRVITSPVTAGTGKVFAVATGHFLNVSSTSHGETILINNSMPF